MYNTVIVPTDFSSKEATIQLLQKAEAFSDNNRIVLLHVIEGIPNYEVTDIPAEFIRNLRPNARKKLKKLIESSKVNAGTEIREGSPYREILKSVEEHDADLIILNSHQPGLQAFLLGSTAAKIVRHSPCSVLVER